MGIVAATDSYNAEVMIQILNLIEGREIKPPVRETISEMITSDESIEDDDVPHTFEQVAKDQREVDQSIRAFGSANLFQAETLENILNKQGNTLILKRLEQMYVRRTGSLIVLSLCLTNTALLLIVVSLIGTIPPTKTVHLKVGSYICSFTK